MEPNLLKRVLKIMSQGPLTRDSLAQELGVSAEEAEALIGALLAHGYLREVNQAMCASCPLRGSCAASTLRGVRVYELTNKAAEHRSRFVISPG